MRASIIRTRRGSCWRGTGSWLLRAVVLLTIVSTAQRYHLDIWLYVKDVLDRLLQGEQSE